jgi:hypothetical protein
MKQSQVSTRTGTLAIALVVCASFAASAAAAAAAPIRASVDGNMVAFSDAQPIMSNGRVMVPMRGIFEKMDASVNWDASNRSVTATRGSDSVSMAHNSSYATVNGKSVGFDAPITMNGGRTMVPLRFISESFGARVFWNAPDRVVEVRTTNLARMNDWANNTMIRIGSGTVLPFKLVEPLSSNGSQVGQRFTAQLDTNGMSDYQGLPIGTILHGHVDYVRARNGREPGVLNMAFDHIVLNDGTKYVVRGTLIGLDDKSVTLQDGRWAAKSGSRNDTLTYVGIGAGAGMLVALLTKGNVFTDSIIGGALGLLLSTTQRDPSQSRDVSLSTSHAFGVKLTEDLTVRGPLLP